MTPQDLSELAQLYRISQFYAHMAHNLTSGPTFFQDHAFLGDLYGTYETAYDDIIERMIGLGAKPDIPIINKVAADSLSKHGGDSKPEQFFAKINATEKQLRALIDKVLPGQSQGTTNFLQGLADESEVRGYKIGQRVK